MIMTVAELKEKLQYMPDDAYVLLLGVKDDKNPYVVRFKNDCSYGGPDTVVIGDTLANIEELDFSLLTK